MKAVIKVEVAININPIYLLFWVFVFSDNEKKLLNGLNFYLLLEQQWRGFFNKYCLKEQYPVTAHAPDFDFWTGCRQPRPQGLLAFQYGGGRREDPGTQRTKTIADWCILLRVHTYALIGLFIPKQRWLSFEGFVEAEKCFLQCLRPKWWTEFRSDCSENCDCTVGRQRFEDSDI